MNSVLCVVKCLLLGAAMARTAKHNPCAASKKQQQPISTYFASTTPAAPPAALDRAGASSKKEEKFGLPGGSTPTTQRTRGRNRRALFCGLGLGALAVRWARPATLPQSFHQVRVSLHSRGGNRETHNHPALGARLCRSQHRRRAFLGLPLDFNRVQHRTH